MPLHDASRARVRATRPPVIRVATSADVDAIHRADRRRTWRMAVCCLVVGRKSPRMSLRFLVAIQGRRVVACADLAPLSRNVG